MKKIILFSLLLLPFTATAQQEMDTTITNGHNFIEVLISGGSYSLKKKNLKVFYKCKIEGNFILNSEHEKYKFESYAEILDYFEMRGWDYFMPYPEFVSDPMRAIWIMRRR